MPHFKTTFDVYRTNCRGDILAEYLGQVDARDEAQALRLAARIYGRLPGTELWVDRADMRIAAIVDRPRGRTHAGTISRV